MPPETNEVGIDIEIGENLENLMGVLAAPLQAGKVDIDVHLPQNKPVTFRLKLGRHKPLDWVGQVEV